MSDYHINIRGSCGRPPPTGDSPVCGGEAAANADSPNGATAFCSYLILYSEEDGGYIADIPDLEHCSAFGETPEEALAEVQKVKAACLRVLNEAGIPIPPPRYRPVIYQVGK